jgi:hypothetical protein
VATGDKDQWSVERGAVSVAVKGSKQRQRLGIGGWEWERGIRVRAAGPWATSSHTDLAIPNCLKYGNME